MNLKTDDLLFVRPSQNNMHEFVALENSCFFDICLPNYTPDNHSRRITYFKEVCENPHLIQGGITSLEYDTTPPHMPVDFSVNDLDYRGEMMWKEFRTYLSRSRRAISFRDKKINRRIDYSK